MYDPVVMWNRWIIQCALFTLAFYAGLTPLNAQWQKLEDSEPKDVWRLAVSDSLVLAAGYDNGLFVSTQSGSGLKRVGENFYHQFHVAAVRTSESHTRLFTHEMSGSLYYSDDTGKSWQSVSPPNALASNVVSVKLISGRTRLFVNSIVGLDTDSIYSSDNFGDTWQISSDGYDKNSTAESFAITNGIIFTAGRHFMQRRPGEIYRSTDDGRSWAVVKSSDAIRGRILSMRVGTSYGYLFVTASTEGIWRSTDLGATWETVNNGLPRTFVTELATKGDLLIATVMNRGVFLSRDKGKSWTFAGQGLTDSTGSTLAFNNEFAFYGGRQTGLWRRPLAEFYALDVYPRATATRKLRVYPNPTTHIVTIECESKFASDVSVEVFSADGKLVHEEIVRNVVGECNLTLDSRSWPNGAYTIVLKSGDEEARQSVIKN